MAIEVPQNEEISGGGKNGGRKKVGSIICRRRVNGGSVDIKKRDRVRVVSRGVDPYKTRVGVQRRKKGSINRKFWKG